MAKSLLRQEARELRETGMSQKEIAQVLGISRNSASRWVKDIDLTEEQIKKLLLSELQGKALGRIKTAAIKKQKREDMLEEVGRVSKEKIGVISNRDLFIAGLCLYWAEGGKKNRRIEFCNSDPRMIKFIIRWLETCFGVNTKELTCVVGINIIHEYREQAVKDYWSSITGISQDQFRKTSFKRVSNKKVYDNLEEHFGTLSIVVAKSTNLYYQMMGLISALH